MHSVAAAGVAALYTKGPVLPSLVSGGATGCSLFFGAPIVEDLSKKVAGTLFTEKSACYMVAEIVVDIALRSFAAFVVVNLALSVLAGSLITPFPAEGALVAGVVSHSFNQMMEILLATDEVEDSVGLEDFYGKELGTLTEDGHSAEISHSENGTTNVKILSLSGDKFRKGVSPKGQNVFAQIQDASGEKTRVIISKGIVYEVHQPE